MPKVTYTSPFELTDAKGVVRRFEAGEQDVPQDVADNPWAQAHTSEGIPGMRKAPETEAEHAALFEHLAKRAEAADMALQPASDPHVAAAGTGQDDGSPSADNMPASPTKGFAAVDAQAKSVP